MEEDTWKTVALIKKGTGDFWGIGLVKFIWKMSTVILNHNLGMNITFHDILHRFQYGIGVGTALLEAKLPQQLTAMGEEVIYNILLDLHKAYN